VKAQREDLKVKVRETEFELNKVETKLQVKSDKVKELQAEVGDLQI
jgi:Tfp pilus assembly protein FimV